MLNSFLRKPAFWLELLIFLFLITACGGSNTTVDPYRDKTIASTRSRQPAPSKPLPVFEKNMQGPATAETPPQSSMNGTVSQSVPPDAFLPVLTQVADRRIAYEDKLQVWEDFSREAEKISLDDTLQENINTCQARLQEVLTDYNQLHEQLIADSADRSLDIRVMEEIYRVERSDISFLESECQQIILSSQKSGTWIMTTQQRLLEESENEIATAMTAGDYNQAIIFFEQLSPDQRQRLSFASVFSYGQSLLRVQRYQEARQVFLELLRTVQQDNKLDREFKLMKLVADIQFGLEDYPEAFNDYLNIINRYAGFGDNIEWARKQQNIISSRSEHGIEVKKFAELMLAYLGYAPERDGFKVVVLAQRFMEDFPGSVVLPTVNRILFESQDRADAWFAAIVQRLNLLEDEKKYGEALKLTEELPFLDLPMDKREYIRSRADDFISSQFQEVESKRLERVANLEETWTNGQNHLRAKEYDRAIEFFTTLLDTEYTDRARAQIDEAANLAAQDDRRKAAELFVRSGGSRDLDTRIRLLFESRQLLQNILIKYPQSDLVKKVRRNLERIEQEINDIDPNLLENPPEIETKPAARESEASFPANASSMNVGELQVQPTSTNWSESEETYQYAPFTSQENGIQE